MTINYKQFRKGIIIGLFLVLGLGGAQAVYALCTPTLTSPCTDYSCPSPTVSPSVTDTPTDTPIPTGIPCDNGCVTPSPTVAPTETPTPTATPSGGQGGGGGGQSNNAPAPAVCGTSFDAPKIVSFTSKGNGTVNFAWTEDQGNISKYSITYGYSADNLNMGQDNISGDAHNVDIHQLNPGSHVWAQVQAWMGGCEESSNVFDPVVR